MTYASNLTDVWNWLPVFRAVAETEHLPSASKLLHVTPAAISRTIGLLEDRLEVQLFNRTGKRLVLNGEGRVLLARVQEAMNNVERGLQAMDDTEFSGPVRVSSIGVLTNHFVLPAILKLRAEHPDLEPELRNLGTRDAVEALLRGSIDVAFIYEPMTLEGIQVERLGESTSSIYCGREHPGFSLDEPDIDDLLQYPFSVPQIGDTGQVLDGWPSDVARSIGMRITLLTTNLEICLSGAFITILPDITARPFVLSGELRRFDFDRLPAASVFAARRKSTDGESRARGVVDAVAECVAQVEETLRVFRQTY